MFSGRLLELQFDAFLLLGSAWTEPCATATTATYTLTKMENEAAVLRDAAADAQAVYTFVGWMLVIGALSLVAVQRRKLKSASLYDRRSKA